MHSKRLIDGDKLYHFRWVGADGISGPQIAGKLDRVDVFAGAFYMVSSDQGPNFPAFSEQWAKDMPSTKVPEFTEMPLCIGGRVCKGQPDFTGWAPGKHDTSLAFGA